MRGFHVFAIFLTVPLVAAPGGSFTFDDLILTVPEGFVVEQVAGPPLVDRPIMADFDHEGFLYVADSSGSNADVQTQLREKPHRVVRLQDTDEDGVYDQRTVFADELMFPEGVLCYRGSVYVSAPPVIWKLTDKDRDGICDEREVWHDGKTLTGCANDLHGPYLGPDGWLYWCKGAFAEQTYPRPDKPPFTSKAAHIFRKHPDGGPVEAVMTGGMDNPVEVAFSPEGERFFTTTFLQHPSGGKRDGIIHAIYGGVYGKDHHVIRRHPRTGPLMPVMTHLGPAAPCGLMRYTSSQWGRDYHNNLFATQFNLRKITRHQLVPEGASYQTIDSDFLSANLLDFHPTDILEDGAGSLLVVDTGGWYKLCCPTSQLAKPDVLGAIYRVRREDAAPAKDPFGREMAWQTASPRELCRRLGDERYYVRCRALDTLAQRDVAAIPSLTITLQSADTRQALAALWALTKITDKTARIPLRRCLTDDREPIQHAAIHAAAVHRDQEALPDLLKLLKEPSIAVKRAAAEALGRLSDVPPQALLDALGNSGSPILRHSLLYSLIEQAPVRHLRSALPGLNETDQRHALRVLSQIRPHSLEWTDLEPFLDHADRDLRRLAWSMAREQTTWREVLASHFVRRLTNNGHLKDLAVDFPYLAESKTVQKALVDDWIESGAIDQRLEFMKQSSLKNLPKVWAEALTPLLSHEKIEWRQGVLEVLSRLPANEPAIQSAIARLASAGGEVPELRLLATDVAMKIADNKSLGEKQMQFLLTQLHQDQPLSRRTVATTLLTKHPPIRDQLDLLTSHLPDLGPMELAALLPVYQKHAPLTSLQASALLGVLDSHPSVQAVPAGVLQSALAALPDEMAPRGKALLRSLDQSVSAQAEHLEHLLSELPEGDITRGRRVFNQAETACSSCHAMGYRGGKLGPDLTRIGQIRSRRDLLESIIFPSASFVRSYETVQVTTQSGDVYLGIEREMTADTLTLEIGLNARINVRRREIADKLPGKISLMPPGLETLLTKQQLADLLAFLENARW